jgi:hypothetical protein
MVPLPLPPGCTNGAHIVHGISCFGALLVCCRHAGDEVLPVSGFNTSGPLTVMATRNTTTKALIIFLANFAPDDNKPLEDDATSEGDGHGQHEVSRDGDENGICYKMRPNKCTEASCYLKGTDWKGSDLLPESQKFKTDNASACCDACLHFKVDKFCQAWSWRESGSDPHRCYLKSGDALSHKDNHATGMIGGFPNGIEPPASKHSYYNISRTVKLTIASSTSNDAAARKATLTVINSTCANPKALWMGEMNSVTWPSDAQLAQLRTASAMCEEELEVTTDALTGAQTVEVTLEAYAAAMLKVEA